MQASRVSKNQVSAPQAAGNQHAANTAKALPAVPVLQKVAEEPGQLPAPDTSTNNFKTFAGKSNISPFQLKSAPVQPGTDALQLKPFNLQDHQKTSPVQTKAMAHNYGCCCGNCQGATVQRMQAPVVQRVQYLHDTQVNSLTEAIDEAMDAMQDAGLGGTAEHDALYRIYNGYQDGSRVNETLGNILNNPQTGPYIGHLKAVVQGMLNTNNRNIRRDNYPSTYTAQANTARDTYQAGRLDATNHPGQWQCPGNGNSTAAHWTLDTDITIDHILPVASHWNNTGYNTNRATRTNWYSDTSNHRYMCQSCNSALGSGGITYRIDTGPNYS